LGEQFNPDDVMEILKDIDKDGSGLIDLDEFAQLVSNVGT
jgi:Ca2+-binding EF-hand superfamily protein